MTEEEAKTKWCPFTRAADLEGNRGLVSGHEHPQTMCIGSACMAWRWEPDTKRGPGPLEEKKLPPGSARELGRRAGFVWVPGKREDEGVTWGLFPRIGFCGLAGKP